MEQLIITYALLGYLKETSSSQAPITELYIPIVKKALSEFAKEKKLTEIKGSSMSEIQLKIKSIFEIEMPIPILSSIMKNIANEINDENVFAFYGDNSFIVKCFSFEDIDELVRQENQNIDRLEQDYSEYCKKLNVKFDFDELKKFILAQQIDLFTENKAEYLDTNYYVAKYINDKIKDDEILKIITNIYLGSIVSSYLELNITQKVTESELLLDTNFFISLMDLNTEDAHYTCKQLFDLCNHLGFRFTILSSTLNQIRVLLGNRINDFASKEYIGTVRCADIFTACIRRHIDKTELETIRDSIYSKLNELGVVIIQDAQIKDLIEKAKKLPEYKNLIKIRHNNEESALNDCVARLYVESKRGKYIQGFSDVKCWFLNNSYTPSLYSSGHKIYERYLISANELLVLLWLSNPSLGDNIKMDSIAKSGILSYVTKYRRSKMPSIETLKVIKGRVDKALKSGSVNEQVVYNLCIRMAEGSLTKDQVNEDLLEVDDNQFSTNLKNYSDANDVLQKKLNEYQRNNQDQESAIQKQKAQLQEQGILIEGQNKTIENNKEVIEKQGLELKLIKERLDQIDLENKKNKYQERKEEFIKKEIKMAKKYRVRYIIGLIIIVILWLCNNSHPKIKEPWASFSGIILFIVTTIGLKFFDPEKFSEIFNTKKLRNRLGEEFDKKNIN
jgi:hypothetical protein